MLASAFVLAYRARNILPLFTIPFQPPTLMQFLPTMLLHVGMVFFIFYITRLYHMPRVISRIDQARKILGAVTVGAVLAFGIQGLIFKGTNFEVDYPRALFFYAWVLSAVLVILGREVYRNGRLYLRKHGVDNDNLLIIGTGKIARDITLKIKGRSDLGYRVVGAVNNKTRAKGNLAGVPVIGTYADVPAIIDAYNVEQVIIALPDAQRTELVDLITMCQRGSVDIKVYPDMFAYMAGDLNVDELGGTPLITVRDIALRGWKLSLKRSLDILGSFVGLICFSPLMIFTAILIRRESPGPVFHIQERMGLDGHPFPMIKFRSMRLDAEVHRAGLDGRQRSTPDEIGAHYAAYQLGRNAAVD